MGWISVKEAASIIGITPQGVRSAIASEKLLARRSGGIFLVDEDAARAYVVKGTGGRPPKVRPESKRQERNGR